MVISSRVWHDQDIGNEVSSTLKSAATLDEFQCIDWLFRKWLAAQIDFQETRVVSS